jgi:hypothetical protein
MPAKVRRTLRLFPVATRDCLAALDKKVSRCLTCDRKSRYDKCPVRVSLEFSANLPERGGTSEWPSESLVSFVSVHYHRPVGADEDVVAGMSLTRDVRGGLIELDFCSTRCLRGFLDKAVDELETRIRVAESLAGKPKLRSWQTGPVRTCSLRDLRKWGREGRTQGYPPIPDALASLKSRGTPKRGKSKQGRLKGVGNGTGTQPILFGPSVVARTAGA